MLKGFILSLFLFAAIVSGAQTSCTSAYGGELPEIQFQQNSTRITKEAATALNTVVAFLLAHPECTIVIQGHCGSTLRQLSLSHERVLNVAQYIRSRKVPASQVVWYDGTTGTNCPNTVFLLFPE
jgi:outer membrane protein OmpA-like peptidoglycan-associated protein